MKPVVCLYAGSFDPVTNGHLSLIRRASEKFDRVFVAVMKNAQKQGAFPVSERVEMLEKVCAPYENVSVLTADGLTCELAKRLQAGILLRGLRGAQDLEVEMTMARINHRLNPDLETVFLPPEEGCEMVSSSMVREIAALGGDIDSFVPPAVRDEIIQHYAKGGPNNG